MVRHGRRPSARKSIFDPVHGPIPLEGGALDLVGTRVFQRLWRIRQTGLAHLVFPGANHTRLEHSLGVYWVAGRMADALALSADDRLRVTWGGLLHDVGHPPFSHTLEPSLREALGIGHEAVSRALITGHPAAGFRPETSLPSLLESFGVDPRSIADLVDPPRAERFPLLRRLLHGPVDADRIDYLQRDAHYTGVAHGAIDAARLLDTLRSVGSRLAFAEKGRAALEGFLVGRALMYSSVYYHKTVRAAEVMVQAAVERFPGYPASVREWFRLTDGDLFPLLQTFDGVSSRLAAGVLDRRLYKRAHAVATLSPTARRSWIRRVHAPADRRALEDEIAGRVGAPRGAILLDVAGTERRGDPPAEWRDVGLVGTGRVVYPYRTSRWWRELAVRPPSDVTLAVYTPPRWRERTARLFLRDASFLP